MTEQREKWDVSGERDALRGTTCIKSAGNCLSQQLYKKFRLAIGIVLAEPVNIKLTRTWQ